MKNITLIGCTGSIGRQACNVVRRLKRQFRFSSLICGRGGEALSALANEFHPDTVGCLNGDVPALPQDVTCLKGEEILSHCFDGCDIALIAVGGFAGLNYTLKAAECVQRIALANKESLVCGGELVLPAIKKHGVDLVPVDSEHSALWQALHFRRNAPFERLILTASGGPFFKYTEEQLSHVTVSDTLRHPTWKMGAKITVDSATLLNKGYEVIEAKWLYGTDFSHIEAIVHPESIVHSLVSFRDGAVLAQMGYPTMELPIQLSLTYPKRLPCEPQLDLNTLGDLHFYPLPQEKFPCYRLALEAGKAGGSLPTVLNAAAEEAVNAFLAERITFTDIADTIGEVLSHTAGERVESFEQLQTADATARAAAKKVMYAV